MTTTSTFQGMSDDAKPTSRVLRPPGGGSSNIFGSDPSPAAAPARSTSSNKPQDSGIFGASSGDSSQGAAQRSARDGENSFNRLFGDVSQKSPSAGPRADTHANLFGDAPDCQGDTTPSKGMAGAESSHDKLFGDPEPKQRSQGRFSNRGRGSYNPITGSDYKDLAPNHHALNVKETPKAQKEQPPLPCSDEEFQVREGKMQNVQTSTRVTNPPGGKTHKLW